MARRKRPRVLCVDDEPDVLAGLRLTLVRRFDVTLATGPEQGLAEVEKGAPFEVILSDMRMPIMDGAAFLSRCRQLCPDTTRMLLTGYADLDSSIRAVNEGQIFRFLTKPCPPEILVPAMTAAARQYRLVTAEHVLLEQTLRGTIQSMVEILGVSNPAAYGRTGRIKRWARQVSEGDQALRGWTVQVAAMLSQLSTVSLPPETMRKLHTGKALDEAEQAMVDALPATTHKLLGRIPRLEPVLEILDGVWLRYDGQGSRSSEPVGDQIPAGSRLIRILTDLDTVLEQGLAGKELEDRLRAGAGEIYDPELLERVMESLADELGSPEAREVDSWALAPGMVLTEPVRTLSGTLLVPAGQEITETLATRLQNVEARSGLRPIFVLVSRGGRR